jgi:hypothetical protein
MTYSIVHGANRPHLLTLYMNLHCVQRVRRYVWVFVHSAGFTSVYLRELHPCFLDWHPGLQDSKKLILSVFGDEVSIAKALEPGTG